MNMNTVKIYCKNNSERTLSFYVNLNNEKVYLFKTGYFSNPILTEYKNGVSLAEIFVNTRKIRQQRLKERIILSLKYIEKYYSVSIFNKTTDNHSDYKSKKRRKNFAVSKNNDYTYYEAA